MDDFDYSVEISDRDWQCFFMECEECNLFPPSLAGVDDSGMSDLDDTASMLAKRVQNHDLTAGLSEAARPVDSSPDSKSPPLEQYLMKQGGSGMESVLSGSEEDIHLQSVNMFFERLRNLPEAERPAERSHVSAGENREAKKEELQRSDGRQASSSTLPENVPKLNSSPARDGAAVDKETMKPVDAISNGNTMKRVKPGVCISLEPAASGSAMKKNRLAYPEFFIREETKAKPQCHDSPTAEMTSYTDKVNVCTTLDGVRQQGLSTGLFSNHEMFTAPDVLQPDATIQNRTATQQPSPSASVKRKRRKKRRLSIEPVESGLVCERQVLGARTDDSEEEQRPWRGAAGCSLSELDTSSLCPVTSNAPARISTEEVEVKYRSDKVEELSGLNKYCWLPRSVAASGAGKSDALEGTGNGEGIDAHAESLQQQNKVNHVNIYCESCSTAEVKSITHSILQRAGLNNPDVEVSQNDNVSVAKSVLAGEGGYSSRYKHTLCQREAEQQQQLEIDTDQYSSTLGKTGVRPPGVCETGRTKSDAHNIKLQQFKTSPSPFSDDIFCKVSDAKLADDWTNSSSDQSCLSVKQTECPLETRSLSKSNFLTEKASGTDADRSEPPQITSLCSQREPKLLTSPSDITPLSPCSTLDTVVSVSNENITDLSASFCSSISQNESEGERQSPTLEKDATGPKSQTVLDSAESNSDVAMGAGDAVTPLEAGHKPKSKLSVFTMSSFWGEMEKLTINDILGLRMANNAAPHSSLSPLQEDEEMDMFTTDYSGVFTQLEDSVPDPESLASVMALDSSSSRSVTWEGEAVPVSVAADLYPGNMMLTSAISPPVVSGSAQTCLRKISKNASVHNLHALESEPFSSTLKQQTLPSSNEGGLEKVQCVAEETGPGKDDGSSSSSLRGSYRTSIMDVFRYYFGGKEPVPSQSATDNLTTLYADGNTLPETYDHFFSDFDTESFFCPLITAADAKDELVPIFSYSRSANRNLQFPEAYDYFFASSSSDDSSVESDDEENSGPVRVVSRFTQKTSTSPMSVDAYEHFCTDRDLGQNLFWKDTLSFRNFYLTGSTSQKPSLSSSVSLVPTRQNTTSPQRTVCPSNVLGNQDAVFPDPLLCHLEDRISKQLRQRPFRYDDLQTAVSNPRLDASFLPLRQSDMCLVCIAFASWVLKTANPQVGDAWKAVVLANVSALSAIRYLRKYVKVEAAASEKKLNTDIS